MSRADRKVRRALEKDARVRGRQINDAHRVVAGVAVPLKLTRARKAALRRAYLKTPEPAPVSEISEPKGGES